MTLEELIAQELYSDVKLEDALKYVEADKQNGKHLYSMNEVIRCMKSALSNKINLPVVKHTRDFSSFQEGKIYSTVGACPEPFLIKKIVTVERKGGSKEIVKFIGEYVNRPNLGLCPINPELLNSKVK